MYRSRKEYPLEQTSLGCEGEGGEGSGAWAKTLLWMMFFGFHSVRVESGLCLPPTPRQICFQKLTLDHGGEL